MTSIVIIQVLSKISKKMYFLNYLYINYLKVLNELCLIFIDIY